MPLPIDGEIHDVEEENNKLSILWGIYVKKVDKNQKLISLIVLFIY